MLLDLSLDPEPFCFRWSTTTAASYEFFLDNIKHEKSFFNTFELLLLTNAKRGYHQSRRSQYNAILKRTWPPWTQPDAVSEVVRRFLGPAPLRGGPWRVRR